MNKKISFPVSLSSNSFKTKVFLLNTYISLYIPLQNKYKTFDILLISTLCAMWIADINMMNI